MKVDTFRLLANLEGETFVLHPIGDLDLNVAGQVRDWAKDYLAAGPAPVTLVDLSDVGFMDSVGLGALIDVWKRITAVRCTVIFAAPAQQPARLLNITGLATRLGVYPTVAEGLRNTIIPRQATRRRFAHAQRGSPL